MTAIMALLATAVTTPACPAAVGEPVAITSTMLPVEAIGGTHAAGNGWPPPGMHASAWSATNGACCCDRTIRVSPILISPPARSIPAHRVAGSSGKATGANTASTRSLRRISAKAATPSATRPNSRRIRL